MPRLTSEQLRDYGTDVLQGMAQDIARRKFGESTAKTIARANKDNLVRFILDNQDD